MKKIALQIKDDKLCPRFGQCSHFSIFYVELRTITKKKLIPVPHHKISLYPSWLAEKGVTDVIVWGIGLKTINTFNQHKINVFLSANIKDSKELVQEYIDGTLETTGNLYDH